MAIFNDLRAAWIVSLIALTLASVGGLITVSARAGAIETRVSAVEGWQASWQMRDEKRQADVSAKLGIIAESVARIEGELAK